MDGNTCVAIIVVSFFLCTTICSVVDSPCKVGEEELDEDDEQV